VTRLWADKLETMRKHLFQMEKELRFASAVPAQLTLGGNL